MTRKFNPRPGEFRPLRARLDHPQQREPAFQHLPPPMPARARRRPAPQSSRTVRVFGYIGLGLAFLALTAATFLYIADPAQIVRDQLITRVKQATGRDLEIKGETGITLYPSIGIAMADVSLSPPPGMTGGPTVRMARLVTKLRLLPLLQSKFVVDRLVLTSPVIDLRVDSRGRKSWDFAAVVPGRTGASGPIRGASRPIRYAQATYRNQRNDALPPVLRDFASGSGNAPGASAAGSSPAALAGLSFDDVRIVDGTLHYTDETQGARYSVKAVNVTLALKDITSPFDATGSLNWRGEKISFKSTVQSLKAILDQRPTKLTAKLWGRPFKASYSGALTLADAINLDGRLSASAASVRRLANWLGTPLPPASGFGAFDLNGWLSVTQDQVYLRKTALKFDGATASGDIGVDISRPRPLLRADLQVTTLDLNKYLPPAAAPLTTGSTSKAPRRSEPTSSGPRSINDILGNSGTAGKGRPQVRGYEKRSNAGWSDAVIDLSPLGLIDADAKLRLGALLFKNMKAGRTRLNITLKAGRLQADLQDIELYQGRGKGRVTIDGRRRRSGAALSANVRLSGIAVRPLLRDAAEFDRVDGRGNINFLVTGEGASERQIVSSLLGNGSFSFTDGAIVGVNIPQIMRNLQRGNFGSLTGGPTSRTDFAELSASFQITDGVARNKDLKLISPLLRVTGAGKIALAARKLNYLLRPKLVASLSGQGGGNGVTGFEIPLRVKGPWDNPSIAPELGNLVDDIANDPLKAVEAARDLGKKLKGGNIDKTLQGLLGKGAAKKARGFLDKLLP